jgi:hypothetical protein
MALNIGNQVTGQGWRVPVDRASRTGKMATADTIQYTVDNANMEVIIARSHFRDRVWSPLVLFHQEKLQ